MNAIRSGFSAEVGTLARISALSLAGAILAMAAVLRLSSLSNQSLLMFDTAQVVYNPIVLLKEGYFPYSTARHAYIALVAGVYALAGENLTTASYLSALFGTLAVGLVGILAWSVGRCWLTASLAAGFMAGAYLPIWWSRMGMPYIWAMCVATVGFMFLYRSERDRNPRFFWWGALFLGYAFANHYSMIFAGASYAVWEIVREMEARSLQLRSLMKQFLIFALFFSIAPALSDLSVRLLRFFSGYDGALVESKSKLLQVLGLFFSNADAEVNQSYIREVVGALFFNIHLGADTPGFTYYLRVLSYFEGFGFTILAIISLVYLFFLWCRRYNGSARFVFLFTATPLILHSVIAGTGGLAVPRALVVAYPTLVISIAWLLVDAATVFAGWIFGGSKAPKICWLGRMTTIIAIIVGFGIYGWKNTHSLRALRTYYPAAQSFLRENAEVQHIGVFGNVALWTLLSGRQVRFIYSREDFDRFQRLTGEKAIILQHKPEGRVSWAASLNGVPYKSFPNPVERSVIVSAEEGPGRIPTQDELNSLWGEVRVYIFQ